MYFVNTRKRLTSNTFVLHLFPAGAVLVTVLGLSLLGWRNTSEALKNERSSATSSYASETQAKIRDRLNTYELVLNGAAGLFLASETVTRQEWETYINSFRLQSRYPGINTVGYVRLVRPDQVASVTRAVRSEGFPKFHIYPRGTRSMYSAVLYYEPFRRTAGLGFDMLSEPNRRAAMERAQKTGEASLTAKLAFVVSNSSLGNTGFTIYLPVYTDRIQSALPAAKRAIRGYVFTPITVDKLFEEVLSQPDSNKYGLRVYDASATSDHLLYESRDFAKLNADDHYSHRAQLDVYGRTWTLDFRFSPGILPVTTRTRPVNSLIAGVLFSLLLSGFVLTLLIARTRALAHDKRLEVQDAKDELLSLASHQLRTPATSVKQYLGMLREGFVGDLTLSQTELIEKAYESNERQLHIINELLYVAKIDAKGIVLTPRKIDVGKLIRGLVREFSETAKDRGKKFRVTLPAKKVVVEADEHCLRMAVENLISNALKYSYDSATITVRLTTDKHQVHIAVKDRGIGIAPDEIHLLFQRFSRIPNELSRQASGSGIGLYLSQQLINLHGGDITVESAKGKGTTFVIHLPKTQNFPNT